MTEADLIERLDMVSPVVALVGLRIYALKIPQTSLLPAIRVQRITALTDQHLRGPAYPVAYRFQVDSIARDDSGSDTLGAVQALAAAVKGNGLGDTASGLWGWVGTLGGSPASIYVHNVELVHDGDPEFTADELRQVRVRQDYVVHWSPM